MSSLRRLQWSIQVSRFDPEIEKLLIRGEYQEMLPVKEAEADTHWADSITDLMDNTHFANQHWWIDQQTGERTNAMLVVPTKLMLIVSELAEAMEGHRKSLQDDKLPHRSMLEVELADALIRLLDLAGALDLDLGGAYVEKMRYNAVRPDHKPDARLAVHGKKY